MRRAVVVAVTVALAALVHTLAARWLAGRDVVLALLLGGRASAAAVVLALLAARLFLILLAPGWALFALVMLVRDRGVFRGRRR